MQYIQYRRKIRCNNINFEAMNPFKFLTELVPTPILFAVESVLFSYNRCMHATAVMPKKKWQLYFSFAWNRLCNYCFAIATTLCLSKFWQIVRLLCRMHFKKISSAFYDIRLCVAEAIFIPADFTCYSNVRITEIASNVEFSVIQFTRLTAKYENRTD